MFLLKFFEHVLDPHSKGKQQTCIWAFQVCVSSSVYALISGHFWNRAKRLEIWRVTSQQHFWRFWTSNSNLPRVRSIQNRAKSRKSLHFSDLQAFGMISKHLARISNHLASFFMPNQLSAGQIMADVFRIEVGYRFMSTAVSQMYTYTDFGLEGL